MSDLTMLRSSVAKRFAVSIAGLVVLTACGSAALLHEEERLTFRVVRETPGWYQGVPRGVEEFDLRVGNAGEAQRVHAWWWPAADPNAPAVLYLHGARWSLTGQVFRLEQLREFGFSVLAIDYRGFGKSDGDVPSERTVYEDARVAWDWLANRQPNPTKRYIYGHSLGGAVAVNLAAALSEVATDGAEPPTTTPLDYVLPAAGLIIESTFTTLADMAKEVTWVPVGVLLSQKFDSVSKMAKVNIPVLVVHGAADQFVPSRFSQALYDAATAKKRLLLVEGGSHNNSMRAGADDYRRALSELFGLGAQPEPITARRTPRGVRG